MSVIVFGTSTFLHQHFNPYISIRFQLTGYQNPLNYFQFRKKINDIRYNSPVPPSLLDKTFVHGDIKNKSESNART